MLPHPTINTGINPNDGLGDGLRTNMRKLIANDVFLNAAVDQVNNTLLTGYYNRDQVDDNIIMAVDSAVALLLNNPDAGINSIQELLDQVNNADATLLTSISEKVSYTTSQTLTSAQRLIAQTNIGLQNAALSDADNSFVGQTINGHLTVNLGFEKFYVNSSSGNLGGFTTTDTYISLEFTDQFATSYLSWSGFDTRFTVNHSFRVVNDLLVNGIGTFDGNVTAPNFLGNVIGTQFTSSGGSVQIRNNAGQPIASFAESRSSEFFGGVSINGVTYIRRTGSAAAHADTDLLVADSTAAGSTSQVQILGGNNANSNLYFSDTDSYNIGGFNYQHATDTLIIRAGGAGILTLNTTNVSSSRVIQSNNGFSTGPNAATSGWVRLENQDTITSRNGANSGNRTLMYLDQFDVVQYSVGTNSNFGGSGTFEGDVKTSGISKGFIMESTDVSNHQWQMLAFGSQWRLRDITGGTYPIYVDTGAPTRQLHLKTTGVEITTGLDVTSNATFGADVNVGNNVVMGAGSIYMNNGSILTQNNNHLRLYPHGNGHVYVGNSTNGARIYLYSHLDDGVYTTFEHSATHTRFDTTASNGFYFDGDITAPKFIGKVDLGWNQDLSFGADPYKFTISRSSSGLLPVSFRDQYDHASSKIEFVMRYGSANEIIPHYMLANGENHFHGTVVIGSASHTGQPVTYYKKDDNTSLGWYTGYLGSGGNHFGVYSYENDDYRIYTNQTLAFELKSDQRAYFTSSVYIPDYGSNSAAVRIGAASDLVIYHDGSSNYLQSKTGNMYYFMSNDASHVWHVNGVQKMSLTSSALNLYNDLRFADGSTRYIIGPTNEDLRVHASPNSASEGFKVSIDNGSTYGLSLLYGNKLNAIGGLYLSSDGSSGYAQSRIRYSVDSDVRGAGTFSYGPTSNWFWGNPYQGHADYWMIGKANSGTGEGTAQLGNAIVHISSLASVFRNNQVRVEDIGINATFHQFETNWNTNVSSSIATYRSNVGTWRFWSGLYGGAVFQVDMATRQTTFNASVTATDFIGNWHGNSPSDFATASHTHSYDNYQSFNLKTEGVQRKTIQSGNDLDFWSDDGTIAITYNAGGRVNIQLGAVDYEEINSTPDLSIYRRKGEIEVAPNNTSTAYTLATTDKGKVTPFSSSSNITITVNTGSLTSVGDIAYVDAVGTGKIDIATGPGVTFQVNSGREAKSDGQYSRIAIHKVGSATYRIFGELKSV